MDRRQGGGDPRVVGHPAVLQRDVEVHAHEDPPPGQVAEVLDGPEPRHAQRFEATSSVSSTSRFEKPHSLSYQPITLTMFPMAIVESASNTHECGSPTMSEETSGSSVYLRIPRRRPSAAVRNASLISSTVASRSRRHTRSVTEPTGTGTRNAMPSIFPLSLGMANEVALAAPVLAGTMLMAAARARRRSLWGRSSRFWSFV